MNLIEKFGRVLIINIVILVILLVTLLFFIQKQGAQEEERITELAEQALLEKNIQEVYKEVAEKPYFADHPEELERSELKFDNFIFTKGFDEFGTPIPNPDKEFAQGELITFSFDIYDYMNPKVEHAYYVYGMKIWAETRDSEGNIVSSLTQQLADIADHHERKDLIISFNMDMTPDPTVKPGIYTLKITAWDRILGENQIMEEEFKIT